MDKSDQAILDKIYELSEQRRLLPFAAALGISGDTYAQLAESLENLQYAIFSIDNIYEQNWDITPDLTTIVDTYRKYIYQYCDEIVSDPEYLNNYIRNLRAFRDMEVSTRKGISLLDWSLDEFYHLKICDIQLQGMCILWTSGKSLSREVYDAIESYDMLGEVLDDVMDIEEDLETYNPNRLLAEAEEYGIGATIEKFEAFAQGLILKAKEREDELLRYGLRLDHYIDLWNTHKQELKLVLG